MRTMLLALLVVLFLPVAGFCDDLSTSQLQQLKAINIKIAVVHELSDRKVITMEQATTAENLFCHDAQQIIGHEVTPQSLQTLVANAEKTEGLGTFWNVLVVFAGVLGLLGFLALVAYYLRDLLVHIPATGYEILAYIGTAVMTLGGYWWRPFHLGPVLVEPLWAAVPGALALMGCILITRKLHFPAQRREPGVYMGPGLFNFPAVMFGLCAAAWAGMAVLYSHIYPAAGIPYFLAFCAVIALQSSLGFSALSMPGCIALGWTDERQVPKSVFSSFVILAVYVWAKLSGNLNGDFALFESGAIFMGAFVYYLGLLVMSSKLYSWATGNDSGRYLLLQIITIASGVAAFYLGSAFHLGALLGVGGTFFVLYLLEKWYEIPWKGIGWAWSLVGVAAFLYFVVGYANTHSEYFIWGIR